MLAGVILSIRMCFVALLFYHGSALSIIAGLGELQSCWLGLQNALRAKAVDRSLLGLVVPAVYLLGGLLRPTLEPTPFALEAFAIGLCLLLIYFRHTLGRSYSVAQPAYSGTICDRGPYAWVRHPQAALHLASRLALVCCWPSERNLIVFVVYVAAAVTALLLEERFLRSQTPGYADYASRVRYRLLPGVI